VEEAAHPFNEDHLITGIFEHQGMIIKPQLILMSTSPKKLKTASEKIALVTVNIIQEREGQDIGNDMAKV